MIKSIVSGNLNQYGNAGQFETDRSTWGFPDDGWDIVAVRTSIRSTAGISSALITKPGFSNSILLPYRFPIAVGKKYQVRANVFVPSSNPIGSDAAILTFTFSLDNIILGVGEIDHIDKTVLDAKNKWATVEINFSCVDLGFSGGIVMGALRCANGGISGGQLLVDQLEIYEYIEIPDPVTCTLDINVAGTIVTNESSSGAGNGSISMAVTGAQGTIEYSKDNGATWQISNLLAGLTTGIYIIKAREQNLLSCVKEYPFAVNHGIPAFDFTVNVTNEFIAGAHDGAISITPNGVGAPFTYSIDTGVTWQLGNGFYNLAPGLYCVVVRDNNGNSIIHFATIAAGVHEFDKIYFSKNPVTLQRSAVTGWGALTNYRLYNEVRIEDVADSGNYSTKLKLELPPDSNGNAVFYLRQAFRRVFTFVPPSFNASTIIRLTDRIKRFKNYFGDLTSTDIVPNTLTQSTANLVMYGGIDKVNYPDLNYFTTYLTANKKFLTWAPVEKYVDRQQEDYLNFWCYGHFNVLKIQMKVYFDDGTNQTAIVNTKVGTNYTELYQLPVGPANSGVMLVDPSKNVIKYELCLLDQTDSIISEVRTYFISIVKHPLTRFFLFLNSLGSYEVLRFTGQATEATDVAKDIIQKFLPYNYNALDGEFEVNQAIIQKKQNYSSGYIKDRLAKQWHEYMIDLLMSPRVYDITNGKRLPIMITSGQHEMDDQNYLRFVHFDARPAYDNDSFTPSTL